MADTKTGTPGFDIDGQTHTYDVGDPAGPGVDPIPTDHGNVSVDNSIKDISKKTKTTLADYMGKKTKVNKYPVDGDYVADSSITTKDGLPPVMPSDDHTTSNTSHFPSPPDVGFQASTDASPDLKGWDASPDLKTDPGARTLKTVIPDVADTKLKKGKEPKAFGSIDGNELLPQVQKNKLGTIEPYMNSVLANNRFSAASTALQGRDPTRPGGDYDPSLRSPIYGDVSTSRLAQVGVALSIRASRELNSAKEGNNPSNGTQEAKAILPIFNQMGLTKVDTSMLEARDILASLTKDSINNGNFTSIGDDSWGSMNNALDPYSGITSLGMIALSVALTGGVVGLFDGIAELLALAKSTPDRSVNSSTGQYILGRSTVSAQVDPNAFPPDFPPDIGQLLGLRPTSAPFSKALKVGVFAFFGMNEDPLKSITSAPGYNAVVARAIIRSTTVIIDKIKGAFKGSAIAVVKNILTIIETLRSSKLIAAFNVFAHLGDQILTERVSDTIPGAPGEPVKKSYIDSLSNDVLGSAVVKNRLNGSTKLAWGSNRSPSLYLLPKTIAGLAQSSKDLGAFKTSLDLLEDKTRASFKLMTPDEMVAGGARIPQDDISIGDIDSVRAIEAELEAEYVPFSFHDVRTNEVIGFHAFIASLTDDYTANYDSVEGFGRVEPVKIYKGTTRRIGMSFYVVSTNHKDFEEMWVKINKLVTLVYPQYTAGKQLTTSDGSYVFTQPFSQMIGASPLIRIRLGDLFRSNYSKFALARLFGAGQKDFKLKDQTIDFQAPGPLKKKLEEYKNSFQGTWIANVTKADIADHKSLSSFSPGPSLNVGFKRPRPTFEPGGNAAFLPVTIKRISFDDAIVEPKIATASEIGNDAIGLNGEQVIEKINEVTSLFDDAQEGTILHNEYRVPLSCLFPTEKTIKMARNAVGVPDESQNDINALSSFLDSEKNAVVKSFESVKGKGLAGVIDSMNFDWFDRVTWETDADKSKAPKMCKVTISFSPIHDISPGIDNLGYNRAPLYPVGFFAKKGG
jgi:hypothetical protein